MSSTYMGTLATVRKHSGREGTTRAIMNMIKFDNTEPPTILRWLTPGGIRFGVFR